jgi:hypothetical protein
MSTLPYLDLVESKRYQQKLPLQPEKYETLGSFQLREEVTLTLGDQPTAFEIAQGHARYNEIVYGMKYPTL